MDEDLQMPLSRSDGIVFATSRSRIDVPARYLGESLLLGPSSDCPGPNATSDA